MSSLLLLLLAVFLPACVEGSKTNITHSVFGSATNLLPAAFGDFNSDELTDLFALRNESKIVEVFLAYDQEPLLRPAKLYCEFKNTITSVVPGDFDGDSQMDILVTTTCGRNTCIHILWGGSNHLICSNEENPFLKLKGQPLAVDYNHDLTTDLFGLSTEDERVFWIFNSNRSTPMVENLSEHKSDHVEPLRVPHSHAFLDVNGDFAPDLYLSTPKGYEIWLRDNKFSLKDYSLNRFTLNKTLSIPPGASVIGQSLFADLVLEGYLQHLVPVCFDNGCTNSTIYVYHKDHWHNLNPLLKDSHGKVWGFVKPQSDMDIDTMTLRAGDFNMDGYPDLLATLSQGSEKKAFLLENVECEVPESCQNFSRTFVVRWDALSPLNKLTSAAVFYDMYQDGILDVILVTQDHRVLAFRNTLDYDANFVKVMVLSGQDRGSNLPGPCISYRTTTQEGYPKAAVTVQLPQSAYFALGLPYAIFGLGRTPNFVDTLTVGVGGWQREWTQIIPNSQMVVVAHPPEEPSKWRARLFVTPSKLILLSVAALTGTCVLIVVIIVGLYLKERREDRIEKLQEAHRFHFDAM
ncbi:T-cell immunomodulatory protein isoform X3 [Anabrus simplex]